MDKSIRRNILLGFFVIVGIILFIVGIFAVGSKSDMFEKTFIITARFSNATGLKVASNVRFNGVKVGIVKAVKLINDTLVQVDMQIEENKHSFMTRNAIATIASDGLMGDKMVNITDEKGGGEIVQNNDLIQSHNALNTDEVLQTLNGSNENIRVITDNLKILTSALNSDNGTIQTLYKDPEMASSLKQSFGNLNLVSNNVLHVSNNLQAITYRIQHGNGTIAEILNDTVLGNDLVNTMSALQETSQRLNTVSNQLSATMQRVNSGKGTVGVLLSDTAFSANVQQSMINIKSASKNLDEDMEGLKHSFLLKKYFRKKAKSDSANVQK